MTENNDIYAQFGPFGKDLEAQTDSHISRLTPSEQKTFFRRVVDSQNLVDAQRADGTRPRPSNTLISIGNDPNLSVRKIVLDIAAEFADQAPEGRSRQCVAFAAFARAILELGGLESELVVGRAEYITKGNKVWGWDHAWLQLGNDIIDGNLDTMSENSMVPKGLTVSPYWGPESELRDRVLKPRRTLSIDRERLEIDEGFPSLRHQAQQRVLSLIKK